MTVSLQRRLFTADEFERMAEAGIFGEDERLELLDGEILQMSPISPRHAWCVNRLVGIFARLGGSAIVSVQNPIRLHNLAEPQPDLALVQPGTDQGHHPTSDEVLLLVEVASSSLVPDRGVKARSYARAAIRERWLIDLVSDRLEVYRDPSPDGFRLVQVLGRGQQVSPSFAPDFVVDVDEILGPPRAES